MKQMPSYLINFLRSLLTLFYRGPWRRGVIRLAEKFAAGRTLPVASHSVISGLDNPALMTRLLTEGFSGPIQVDPHVADEIVANLANEKRWIVPNPHLTDVAVQQVIFDPRLQELLKQYFGCCPLLYGSCIYISNTSGKLYNPEAKPCTKEFHYDLPDFKALTLFVYLNEVDQFGGAHAVIPGSANRLTWHRVASRFMSYEKAVQTYGVDGIQTITGSKGTAFLEDLVNWHKRSVSNAPRYALSATFTLIRKPSSVQAPWIAEALTRPLHTEYTPSAIEPFPTREVGKTIP